MSAKKALVVNRVASLRLENRLGKRISQGELATALGITRPHLSAIENQREPISVKLQLKLIEFFELESMSELYSIRFEDELPLLNQPPQESAVA